MGLCTFSFGGATEKRKKKLSRGASLITSFSLIHFNYSFSVYKFECKTGIGINILPLRKAFLSSMPVAHGTDLACDLRVRCLCRNINNNNNNNNDSDNIAQETGQQKQHFVRSQPAYWKEMPGCRLKIPSQHK